MGLAWMPCRKNLPRPIISANAVRTNQTKTNLKTKKSWHSKKKKRMAVINNYSSCYFWPGSFDRSGLAVRPRPRCEIRRAHRPRHRRKNQPVTQILRRQAETPRSGWPKQTVEAGPQHRRPATSDPVARRGMAEPESLRKGTEGRQPRCATPAAAAGHEDGARLRAE